MDEENNWQLRIREDAGEQSHEVPENLIRLPNSARVGRPTPAQMGVQRVRPASGSRLLNVVQMTFPKYEQILNKRNCSPEAVQLIKDRYSNKDALLRQYLVQQLINSKNRQLDSIEESHGENQKKFKRPVYCYSSAEIIGQAGRTQNSQNVDEQQVIEEENKDSMPELVELRKNHPKSVECPSHGRVRPIDVDQVEEFDSSPKIGATPAAELGIEEENKESESSEGEEEQQKPRLLQVTVTLTKTVPGQLLFPMRRQPNYSLPKTDLEVKSQVISTAQPSSSGQLRFLSPKGSWKKSLTIKQCIQWPVIKKGAPTANLPQQKIKSTECNSNYDVMKKTHAVVRRVFLDCDDDKRLLRQNKRI